MLQKKNDNIFMLKMLMKNKKKHAILNEMPTKYVGITKLKDKMHLYIKLFANNLCKKTCVN